MGGRKGAVLLLLLLVAAACSSSRSSSKTSSSSPSSAAQSSSSSAAKGFALQLSGDLSGSTGVSSTKASRCTTTNEQLEFDGTVSLGGSEITIALTVGNRASTVKPGATLELASRPAIEGPAVRMQIIDSASGRTWE